MDVLKAYKVMHDQALVIDPSYVNSVILNPLIQCLKTGVVEKKSEGRFHKWEQRFMILTNCCLLYFKKGMDQPQKFKALNQFQIINLSEEEETQKGRPNIIKLVFNKRLVAKDMMIAFPSKAEKRSWSRALKDYQINVLEKRMELFAKRISAENNKERSGSQSER